MVTESSMAKASAKSSAVTPQQMRLGLRMVKGLGDETTMRIVEERKKVATSTHMISFNAQDLIAKQLKHLPTRTRSGPSRATAYSRDGLLLRHELLICR